MNKRVNISLPTTTLDKLKAAVPEGKRSQFVAETLEKNLPNKPSLREEIEKSLEANRWIYEEAMKDWSVTETENWPSY